jgi:hypothetical protein
LEALIQEGAMGLLLAACETLEPRQLLLPINLVNRLVLTGQQAFSAQYIQVCLVFSPVDLQVVHDAAGQVLRHPPCVASSLLPPQLAADCLCLSHKLTCTLHPLCKLSTHCVLYLSLCRPVIF